MELEHAQEQDIFREVERNSAIDQNKFWSLLNSRRQKIFHNDSPYMLKERYIGQHFRDMIKLVT